MLRRILTINAGPKKLAEVFALVSRILMDRSSDSTKLRTAGLALFILFLSAALEAQVVRMSSPIGSQVKVSSLELEGVVLIPWSNPMFEQAFQPGRAKGFDLILPFTAVVKNNTEQPIIAYSVVWTGSDGELKGIRSVFDFSSLAAGTGLLAHSMAIVSPSRSLEAGGLYWDEKQAGATKLIADRFSNEKVVNIILDAAVFADGTAVGPDDAHWIPRWKAWLNAEKEVLQTVVKCAPADLTRTLQHLSASPVPLSTKTDESFSNHQAAAQVAILADRSSTYAECLSLAKKYFVLSITAELKEGTTSTIENLKGILQSKTYPQFHRKGEKSDDLR